MQGNTAVAWDISKLKAMSTNSADTCYIAIFEGACGSTAGGVYKISKEWYADHYGGPFAAKRSGAGTCGNLVENWLTISENHGASALTGTRVTYIADFNCDHDTTQATQACTPVTHTGYVSDMACLKYGKTFDTQDSVLGSPGKRTRSTLPCAGFPCLSNSSRQRTAILTHKPI